MSDCACDHDPMIPSGAHHEGCRDKPYYDAWSSCDGMYDAEVKAVPPDLPWPGMVSFEISYTDAASFAGTLTIDDARALAASLSAAASWASCETRRARSTALKTERLKGGSK